MRRENIYKSSMYAHFFSFTIRLEDYESKLADRTLFLVARFNSPDGEWWDNNDHHNYRVGFRKAVSASLSPLARPVASAFTVKDGEREKDSSRVTIPSLPQHLLTPTSQQRSFSAPNTLRYTPMTGALAGIPVVSSSSPNKASPVPPMLVRSMSSPYPPSPSPPQPVDRQPPALAPAFTNPLQHIPRPTSPTARETAARTGSYIRRRLSLSNYVAPGNSPTEEKKEVIEEQKKEEATKGLVTPPTTPPGTVRMKGVGLPSSLPRFASPPPPASPADDGNEDEVEAEQETEEIGEIPSEQKENDDDTPKDEKGLRLDTSSLPSPSSSSSAADSASPKEELLPFSPTSLNASTRSFIPFNQGGYLSSPPTSRDASEDGSGEGGRSSPATGTPPSEPASADYQFSSSSRSMHLVLPDLGLNLSHTHLRLPAEFEMGLDGSNESTPNANESGRVDTSDSSYAAFVRQWCFAQSAPPTPGVHTAPSTSPRNVSSSSSPSAALSSSSQSYGGEGGRRGQPPPQPWLGMDHVGAGYGFPGFNFGVVGSDVGMVGGKFKLAVS